MTAKVRREKAPPSVAKPAAEKAPEIRYSIARADKICAALAKGEPLYRICEDNDLPAYSTVYGWQRAKPEFAERVAQARQAGADYCADRALQVAEDSNKDTAQRDRLLVATLLKRAALIAPRQWGGKGGKDAAAPAAEPPPTVVFYVRRFERVIGPDGKATVRELKPEGLE